MLENVEDVAKRAAVLLDDPTMSRYTLDYQMPWIDQSYDDLDVSLELAGMQYVEKIAYVTLLPDPTLGTTVSDLSYLNAEGQALQFMKFPKDVNWKLVGQPDSQYQASSGPVAQLLHVDTSSSYGALQWKFAQGGLQVTPSVTSMVLEIIYDAMSTDIFDPDQGVIRGTAHILAFDVARAMAEARKGMEARGKQLRADYTRAWNQFKGVLIKNNQSTQQEAQQIHGKRRMGTTYVSAGN